MENIKLIDEVKDKKYYWIKLKDSFMTSDTVDFLMSQPNGANYIILYQMLCLKTINTDGELSRSIGEIIIPFDEEKIQRDCKYFSLDTIRIALSLYKKLGMVYEQGNGVLKITNFSNLIGSETYWAEKKREQRKKLDNVQQMSNAVQVRDKILDIRDKEIKKKEKENIENTINAIFLCWNSQEIIKHSKLTTAIKDAITGALKTYPCEVIKTCITRYKEMLDSEYKYCEYKWTLENFLKQKNAISEFTDEGSKWNSYLTWKSKVEETKKPKERELKYTKGLI